MKYRRIRQLLAGTLALTLALPSPVSAAGIEGEAQPAELQEQTAAEQSGSIQDGADAGIRSGRAVRGAESCRVDSVRRPLVVSERGRKLSESPVADD